MGLLVDGSWKEDVPRTRNSHFIRSTTAFHDFVTGD